MDKAKRRRESARIPTSVFDGEQYQTGRALTGRGRGAFLALEPGTEHAPETSARARGLSDVKMAQDAHGYRLRRRCWKLMAAPKKKAKPKQKREMAEVGKRLAR